MGVDDLGEWLEAGYARAFRAAWLIVRNRDDAQEVVQEAYLRVWRFRQSIPDGAGRDAWLYRVVVNSALSRLRSDKRWRLRDDDRGLETLPAPDEDGPARRTENNELAESVLGALAALPETLRVPVVLRYYLGLSEKEIATAISRRPGTVKSRLHEARARLSADPALSAWATETDAGQEVSL
jgi:RNA polymerase sigma-70 factor (ECF subfamily)